MRKLFWYLSAYKKRMALGLTLKVAGTFAELVLPLIMAYMLDEVAPTGESLSLALWGAGMLVCALAALWGNVVANRMASRVARDTTERLRDDLFAKTLRLSAAQTDKATIPSLVSRLSSDTYHVHNMIGMMQRLGVRAPILLVGGVALTFTVDPMLALVLLVTVPILTAVVVLVAGRGVGLYGRLQRSVDVMVRKVRDDYTGIRVIKALSRTDYESRGFSAINGEVSRNETRAALTMGASGPIMNAVLNVGMAVVLFFGAYRVAEGRAGVGDLTAFTSYFTIILNAVISVGRIFVILSKGTASAGRIAEILNLPEGMGLRKDLMAEPDQPYLRFEGVSFSYGGQAPALQDISFSLEKGESLGILGATGSGKSTLAALLLRFYDPDEGRILIGGRDLRSLSAEELRSKFGVVFQNDFLMAASIGENLDFERDLSLPALEAAVRDARAGTFVAEHGGFEGMLTARGSNLSGGQKQRLLIARALAARPEILILDDSSSALDYRTDAALRKTLLERLPGTTVVMIAQRISSVRFADRILVLDKGRAVGFGSDQELMQTCPLYRQIYRSQHGGSDPTSFRSSAPSAEEAPDPSPEGGLFHRAPSARRGGEGI